VPSETNDNISRQLAYGDSTGAMPWGHLNTAFQVIVLLPAASCNINSIYVPCFKLVGAAIVRLPASVTVAIWPLFIFQLTVAASVSVWESILPAILTVPVNVAAPDIFVVEFKFAVELKIAGFEYVCVLVHVYDAAVLTPNIVAAVELIIELTEPLPINNELELITKLVDGPIIDTVVGVTITLAVELPTNTAEEFTTTLPVVFDTVIFDVVATTLEPSENCELLAMNSVLTCNPFLTTKF
jgi:hypothetical protein